MIIEEKSDFSLITIVESVNLMRFKCFFSPPALFSRMETNDRGKKITTMKITSFSASLVRCDLDFNYTDINSNNSSTLWHFHVHDGNAS